MADPTQLTASAGTLIRWAGYVIDGADGFIFEVVNRVMTLREQGVAETQIREIIGADFETARAAIQNITAKLDQAVDQIQRDAMTRGQNKVAARMGEFQNDQRLVWHAVGSNSCPDCINRHGQIKTRKEWELVGVPQAGTTVCRQYCKCKLIAVDRAQRMYGKKSESALVSHMREGVEQQAQWIREIERARGKEYAPATFNQKLGQWRKWQANDTFTSEINRVGLVK